MIHEDELLLLAKVVDLISDKGWKVNNLDCTLILEKPKMKPHVDSIIVRLSALLRVDAERVAVKAKTNEKMGFTGAGEGIAATAAVSLVR